MAFTHVFSEYSFIWLSTFSLLGFIGLMNMKSWGWVIALITNSLYFSLITTTYIQKNIIEASINKYLLIFLLLFIGISSIYLWIKRFTFWKK
ncbi:MAG: hypothetical protein Q4G63_04540 [Bacteroidia bacterium]|nr:hypothetical protein [Bacteroidia bacterium]